MEISQTFCRLTVRRHPVTPRHACSERTSRATVSVLSNDFSPTLPTLLLQVRTLAHVHESTSLNLVALTIIFKKMVRRQALLHTHSASTPTPTHSISLPLCCDPADRPFHHRHDQEAHHVRRCLSRGSYPLLKAAIDLTIQLTNMKIKLAPPR